MTADIARIIGEIADVGEAAGEFAWATYGPDALGEFSEHVVKSAVRQKLIDVYADDPERIGGLLAAFDSACLDRIQKLANDFSQKGEPQ